MNASSDLCSKLYNSKHFNVNFFYVLIAPFQLSTGEVWVQYNDGSQMVFQSSVTSIKYTDSTGAITR